MLAGADPAGVTMSKRAVAQLAEIRHEFSWAREGATSVVRDDNGRVRWWTFAGDLPNQWLAGSLDEVRHSTKAVTGMSISFDEGVTLEEARVAIRGITEQSLALGAAVASDAVNGLKFSELLPSGVAEQVVLTRLDRRADAANVLDEPVNSVDL